MTRGTAAYTLNVTVPAGTALSNYKATYLVSVGKAQGGGDLGPYYPETYYDVTFQVVNPPPTRPAAAPGPAYSWQGSVAGVNTGNGNKLTTLPIVGWTTRGGMPISVALYHNSQATYGSPAGPKWQMSYFSYLSFDGGNATLHWDNGLSYTYAHSGTAYAPPYGILDKLANNGNGTYTLTSPSQTKSVFTVLPNASGNAYLSSLTDLDGNVITIGHNPDTTVSSVSDGAGRKATFTYDGSGRLSTISDPLGRSWGFNYIGANNDLWFVVDPAVGNKFNFRQFAYDTNNPSHHDIIQAQDHNGNLSHFGYNFANDSLTSATDPVGNAMAFAYNPVANYQATTVMTDLNNHTLTHTYAANRLTSVTDAAGKSESYTYDYNNILTQKTDKNGSPWKYSSHFSNGSSTSTSTDPCLNSSSVTYDADNKPTISTDSIFNIATSTYNTTTNVYSTDGHDDLLSTTVTSAFNVPGTSAPFTATSTVGGYSNGLPTTFQAPPSAPGQPTYTSRVAYDPSGLGLPVSATDPNGHTTTATFNVLGWKTSSTDALGNPNTDGFNHTTTYAYDAWGRVTVVTAPDGTQTGTTYDANGNVLRVSDADAYTATLIYAVHCCGAAAGRFGADAYGTGGNGSPASSSAGTSGVAYPAPPAVYTTARVGTFTYTFPNLTPGQVYTVRLHFVEAGHTAPGQRLFNVSSNGTAILTNFDIFAAAGGCVAGANYPTGAANRAVVEDFTLPANGSGQIVLAFTPGAADVPVCSGIEVLPYGHTVTNQYDADDRLTLTLNGHGDVVRYAYDGPGGQGSADANGNTQYGLLSKKTDGNGHVTTYTYTARSEPYQTFYADGTGESIGSSLTPGAGYGYDGNGNVLTRIKGDGSPITYVYDADNRLKSITYPHANTPNVTFGYDADGRRTSMIDGAGASNPTTWTYADGLHLRQIHSARGDVYYGYDADGRRSGMGVPGLNPAQPTYGFTYSYYPGGQLQSLTNPFSETTTFSYDAADRLWKKALNNGAYIEYGYDNADQTTGLAYFYPGVSPSYSHTYTYEPNGNLSSRSESDGGTNVFTYDGANQLVGELRTGPAPFFYQYAYDGNGNRLTHKSNGQVIQTYGYDAHDKLMTGVNGVNTWDPNGNLLSTSMNGLSYSCAWDDEDRLVSQTLGGHTDAYTYTGLGMRLTKTDPTGTHSYLADGVSPASPLLTDGATAFTPGISETVGNGAGGFDSRFYLADAQGNSRGLLNAGEANTDGYNWDAFGTSISRLGNNPTALAWGEESGYQTDNDSGLRLLGHRYYDSRTGRFISQDPIGDGDNWYAYADNSPMNEDDPTGLSEEAGDFGLRSDDPMSSGSSLWDGFQITTRERTREGEDGWINNADGSMTWGTVWGPWGDWHVVNVTTLGGMGGGGAFAGNNPNKAAGSTWYRATTSTLEHGQHVHQNSKNGARYNREGQPIDGGERPIKGLKPIPKRMLKDFQKAFDNLNPPKPSGAAAAGETAALETAEVVDATNPVGLAIDAGIGLWILYHDPSAGIFTLTWRTGRP